MILFFGFALSALGYSPCCFTVDRSVVSRLTNGVSHGLIVFDNVRYGVGSAVSCEPHG